MHYDCKGVLLFNKINVNFYLLFNITIVWITSILKTMSMENKFNDNPLYKLSYIISSFIWYASKNKRYNTFFWFLIFLSGWTYLSWSHFTVWCRLQIKIKHKIIYWYQLIISYKFCIFYNLQWCMYTGVHIHVYLKEGEITGNIWTKKKKAKRCSRLYITLLNRKYAG